MELKIDDYPNLLNEIKLSSKDILNQIINYSLEFDSYKNKEVEWGMKLPMFIDSFYPFVLKNNKIPTQNEFWDYYVKANNLTSMITSKDIERGIKARLFRTYPSLVRDIHFSTYLNEKSRNSKVIYNVELDVKLGIDILIVFKNKMYSINLFTDTKRAHFGREKKKNRHQAVKDITDIELPVKFKDSHKHGDFFMYGDSELLELRNNFKRLI